MTDESQAWLAQAIRAEAAARGLSIRQLGIKAGIADKVLRRALDGEREMWVSQLVRIAAALGVSVTYLIAEGERRKEMVAPDMAVVDEVLAADTTLTPKQKASLREEAAGGYPLSGDSDPVVPQRRVL